VKFRIAVFNGSRSTIMQTALRRFAILAALAAAALLLTPTLHAASPQTGTPESMLLDAANHSRASAGLPPLQWDASLANAARQHAVRMAQMNTLSHQLPGEVAVQARATQTGARFSVISENVAEGTSVLGLHTQWMNSPPHRANLLDRDVNAVGIAVVHSGGVLFAVEDFAAVVPLLSLETQEIQVGSQLVARGLHLVNATQDARRTCDMDRGWSGQRPASVLRYETPDLSRLPADIDQKLRGGNYHTAAVGACEAGGAAGFARFRIAILLF
jgi:uncharacterized protein YkwD